MGASEMREGIVMYLSLLTDSVYQQVRGTFPDFKVAAWEGQVEVALAVERGVASTADDELALEMAVIAGAEDVDAWSAGVLAMHRAMVRQRVLLSSVFDNMLAALEVTEDENLAGFLASQLSGTYSDTIDEVVGSYPEAAAWVAEERKRIGIRLGLVEDDTPPPPDPVLPEDAPQEEVTPPPPEDDMP